MSIPHEQQFHFADGTSVGSIEELKAKIESISYDEFYGHVNEKKNDFVAWVEGVLKDKELGEKLRKVGSIVETVEILNETLFPEEVEQAELELQSEGVEDFQQRIEEQLFAEAPEPEAADAAPTEEPTDAPPADEPTTAPPSETTDEPSDREPIADEQLTGDPQPGEPVTTDEPAHTPITEMVHKPDYADHHFPVKQFLLGLVFGMAIGLLLGKIIGVY